MNQILTIIPETFLKEIKANQEKIIDLLNNKENKKKTRRKKKKTSSKSTGN